MKFNIAVLILALLSFGGVVSIFFYKDSPQPVVSDERVLTRKDCHQDAKIFCRSLESSSRASCYETVIETCLETFEHSNFDPFVFCTAESKRDCAFDGSKCEEIAFDACLGNYRKVQP